ncbi:hypothetical protein AAFF_G00413290 [Aldrovandia affinis]|uniref:Uncharacterized protein n=1 Tax=Aldrovandia affinis TaxID=143900 RepID=A0AAD7SDC1_9TELE|nr:hypothetical protein AAFF_G00413290 [Aldrovandia affinis]
MQLAAHQVPQWETLSQVAPLPHPTPPPRIQRLGETGDSTLRALTAPAGQRTQTRFPKPEAQVPQKPVHAPPVFSPPLQSALPLRCARPQRGRRGSRRAPETWW